MFPKTKRLSENSVHQTRIKKMFYHLQTWLTIRWTSLGEPKTAFGNKQYLQEDKTNYFLESFFIGIERGFFISELQLTSDEVWESPSTILKTSERLSSNFEDKTTFWEGCSCAIHCRKDGLNFPLYRIWCECFSDSQNHVSKEVSVSSFLTKTQLLSENVNRLQNQIENVILHLQHLTKLTLNIKTNVKETRFRGSIKK